MDKFYIINDYGLHENVCDDCVDIPQLNLFNHWQVETSYQYLSVLLDKSWSVSAIDTLKTIFYIRNCYNGRGYREQFYNACRWLVTNYPTALSKNLYLIPYYGYWMDFWNIWSVSNELIREQIIYLYAQQLLEDVGSTDPSLAAKWAPTENSSIDKQWGFVRLLCEQLGWSRKIYRKQVSALRKRLGIAERLAATGSWGEIEFDDLPKKCIEKFHETLIDHCGERYQRWCLGNKNIIKDVILPHHIIENLRINKDISNANKEWSDIIENDFKFNSLCVCDVSPNMYPLKRISAIDIAIALTLFISSNTNDSNLQNKAITFSEHPQLKDITGESLSQQILSLLTTEWGQTINIPSMLDQLLEQELYPEELYIFTNKNWYESQFLESLEVNYNKILKKYSLNGRNPPKRIYYWELRSTTAPQFDLEYYDYGIVIINGFTEQLCNIMIRNNSLHPQLLYKNIINDPEYNSIKI